MKSCHYLEMPLAGQKWLVSSDRVVQVINRAFLTDGVMVLATQGISKSSSTVVVGKETECRTAASFPFLPLE